MNEKPVYMQASEQMWRHLRESVSPEACCLWWDLWPEAWRTGLYDARLPDVPAGALAELVGGGFLTLTENGDRYRHSGVDAARSMSSKGGQRSVETRRERYGTARPMAASEPPSKGLRRGFEGGSNKVRRGSEVTDTDTDRESLGSTTPPGVVDSARDSGRRVEPSTTGRADGR